MKIGSKSISMGKFGGQTVQTIRYGAQLVWQAIRSMFFTKDGEYIETKDGMIFDCKEEE